MPDVHCHAGVQLVKHLRRSLNHPLHHHDGGSDGGDESVDNRGHDPPHRDRNHAHAHNLDNWSTHRLSTSASHPHHNGYMLANSQREGSEGSLLRRQPRWRDETESIAWARDGYIVGGSKD